MTTETDLRAALHARAADAPAVDAERLLASVARDGPGIRSAAGSSHGRRWAIAGVAAGFVALAAVAGGLVVNGSGGSDAVAPGASSPSPSVADTSGAPGSAQASASPSPISTWPVDPNAPTQPRPAAADWQDTQTSALPEVSDDSAIVFSATDDNDPITAFYVRDHQQLSVLSAGAKAKDSSDALWFTAVQVYLPGSGFEPSSVDAATTVTVGGIERQFGSLPRVLDGDGPAEVPSLVWQVGADWVVLQIDTPAIPTLDQLTAAAARIDVHHG